MTQRQEQEDARPEVTEVAPNVLRMQLPISMPGLGHVNCYALIDGAGRGARRSRPAGHGELARAAGPPEAGGRPPQARAHRDRHALAPRPLRRRDALRARVRRARGRPPQLPLRPAQRGDPRGLGRAPRREARGRRAPAAEPRKPAEKPAARGGSFGPWSGPTPWGGERPRPPFKQRMRWRMMRTFGGGDFVPEISDPVENGNVLRLAGRDWFVLHTPGSHRGPHLPARSRDGDLPRRRSRAAVDHAAHLGHLVVARPARVVLLLARPRGGDQRHQARAARARPPVHRPEGAHRGDQAPPLRAARQDPRDLARARPRVGGGHLQEAVPAAQLGLDGRERDLRAPRASAPGRPGREPARGREADLHRSRERSP